MTGRLDATGTWQKTNRGAETKLGGSGPWGRRFLGERWWGGAAPWGKPPSPLARCCRRAAAPQGWLDDDIFNEGWLDHDIFNATCRNATPQGWSRPRGGMRLLSGCVAAPHGRDQPPALACTKTQFKTHPSLFFYKAGSGS